MILILRRELFIFIGVTKIPFDKLEGFLNKRT